MSYAMIAVAGASLISGSMSADSARAAGESQAAGSRQALSEQQRQYDQARQDNEVYRQAGTTGLNQLADPKFAKSFSMSDFQADPGYQYRMDEANKALQRSAAAKGGLLGGQTLKGLAGLNQDMASQEYGNAYNRFNQDQSTQWGHASQLAGYGLSANGSNQAAGQNYANNSANIITSNANAQGASQIAQGNAWGGAINGVAGAAGQYVGSGGGNSGGGGNPTAGWSGLEGSSFSGDYKFSDSRLKENVTPISPGDMAEIRSTLKAVRYHYKNAAHGTGEQIGILAQDLEKSKIGRTLVSEDADGFKRIHLGKVLDLFLASMAEG